MPRIHLLLFLMLSATVVPSQTASDLTSRYGNSDVERFRAPMNHLMVRHADDRTACEMVIEPMRSIIPCDEGAKYIHPEVMTEIIDVVLPEADRGALTLGCGPQSQDVMTSKPGTARR
jgi:hypothetical protein